MNKSSLKRSTHLKRRVLDIRPAAGSFLGKLEKTVYLRRHIYRRHPVSVSLAAVFLVLVAVFMVDTFSGRANTVYWYPKSCLGGWINPINAAGAPELTAESADDDFNADNSAILDKSISQIFCGEFDGNMPPDSPLISVKLNLSWAFKAVRSSGAVAQSDEVVSSTVVVPVLDAASSTPESGVNSEGASESVSDPVVESAPDPVIESVPEAAPASDATPTSEEAPALEAVPASGVVPSPASVDASGPAAWILRFIKTAFAQDLDNASATLSQSDPIVSDGVERDMQAMAKDIQKEMDRLRRDIG